MYQFSLSELVWAEITLFGLVHAWEVFFATITRKGVDFQEETPPFLPADRMEALLASSGNSASSV